MFIGYVNKLKSNYGKLQPNIIVNLFKSYCCLFYGSILWNFNTPEFDQIWNIAIRTSNQIKSKIIYSHIQTSS